MKRDGFVFREVKGIPYYSCRAFEELPGFYHGFSTRRGGAPVSADRSLNLSYSSWDLPERVNENRRHLLSALHLDEAHLATLHQIHSNRVHIIRDLSVQWNQSEGDALVTQLENVALAVQVADCLPVLIADPVTKAVAAVHSGWRGTLLHILPETIREMQSAFGSDPEQLRIAVGPGIRACCFEVGTEVVEAFNKEFSGCRLSQTVGASPGKYLLDLCMALEIELDKAGIRTEHRYDLGLCTRCNTNEFFSYRAEGMRSGRMMAIIGRLGRKPF
jgi:YfiH family protein